MNITDYLFDKAGGLITRHPEVRDNEKKGYEMADDGGVELEVGEFLYGLTRLIKPKHVLTTGIYTGISDMYIAQGLIDNHNGGFSTALEIDETHLKRAKELWLKTETSGVINPFLMKSLNFKPNKTYDLMFLDTEPQIRFQELVNFYPYLEPGGYVGIHDTPRNLCQGNVNPDHPEISSWPFGDLPVEIKNWLRDGDLVKIQFPNPRGLTFFYKQTKDDYKLD